MSASHRSQLFRFFASLQLAVLLLGGLAAVLAWATYVETQLGRPVAQWYVYDSPWFTLLFALLGVNIFCAAAVRFPWKRHQTGFVITHLGLLVLLVGAALSHWGGIEGQLTLAEGDSASHLEMPERSRISASWADRPQEPPYEFSFEAGPVDWPTNKTLDVGEVDGIRTRILRFVRHAEPQSEWLPDEARRAGPVVQFVVTGQDGTRVAEPWLADQQFGDAQFVGPLRLQLERAGTDRMVQDFLYPPLDRLGANGLLAIYFQDLAIHVPLNNDLPRSIPLGDTGATVEIVDYLPHAVPDRLGNFSSRGPDPRNPMVELRVTLPGDATSLRQIAFVKDPFLNLDRVNNRFCPVRFRLYHAAVKPPPSFELMQASNGRLAGRIAMNGEVIPLAEISPGYQVTLPGNFEVQLAKYLPHGRQVIHFDAVPIENRQAARAGEPAALVEITVEGARQKLWMQRNDPVYGRRAIATKQGTLLLNFEPDRVSLGFSLTLLDFERRKNPGNVGDASFASRVRLVDARRQIDDTREIAMNQPLVHDRFTVYQANFDEREGRSATSTFAVTRDPGRAIRYVGGGLVCAGIGIMFLMRAYSLKPSLTFLTSPGSVGEVGLSGPGEGAAALTRSSLATSPAKPGEVVAEGTSRNPRLVSECN